MDCNICLRKYSQNEEKLTPRILPKCGHTLCEECGTKLMKDGVIGCPFDRTASRVRGSIQNLPKNFAILELLEQHAPTAPRTQRAPDSEIRNSRENNENLGIFGPEEHENYDDNDEISLEEYMYNLRIGGHEEEDFENFDRNSEQSEEPNELENPGNYRDSNDSDDSENEQENQEYEDFPISDDEEFDLDRIIQQINRNEQIDDDLFGFHHDHQEDTLVQNLTMANGPICFFNGQEWEYHDSTGEGPEMLLDPVDFINLFLQ